MKRSRPTANVRALVASRQPAPSCPTLDRDRLLAAAAAALGPELDRGLGFDLPGAVAAGRARLLVLHTTNGGPLPADWAIPIHDGEVVVACHRLEPPLVGVAAIVVDASVLPRVSADAAALERVANALADMLLEELRVSERRR